MNRNPETQLERRAPADDVPWWGALIGKMGGAVKWVVIGVVCLMLACCAPVAIGGWWMAKDIEPVAKAPLLHPAQVVGTVEAPIACDADEWVMSWVSEGKTRYSCTAKWK